MRHEPQDAEPVCHAGRFGSVTGSAAVDMGLVLGRKREMVDDLVAMHFDLFKTSGAELIMGHARLTAPKTVEVRLNGGGARMLLADWFVLSLGTHATIPDIPGLADAMPLTNVEILELGTLPDHLIVLGGGYVGLELAQCFRRLASAVTIIKSGPRLAVREDSDVGEALRGLFEDEGVSVELGVSAVGAEEQSGEAVTIP